MTAVAYEIARSARRERVAELAGRVLSLLRLDGRTAAEPVPVLTADEIETGIARLLDQGSVVRTLCTRDLGHVRVRYLHLDCDLTVGSGGRRVYLVTATAVDDDGGMEPVGVGAVDAGDAEGWARFVLSLRVRGLTGIEVVGSSCADQVREAVAAVYPGACWRPSGRLAALP